MYRRLVEFIKESFMDINHMKMGMTPRSKRVLSEIFQYLNMLLNKGTNVKLVNRKLYPSVKTKIMVI